MLTINPNFVIGAYREAKRELRLSDTLSKTAYLQYDREKLQRQADFCRGQMSALNMIYLEICGVSLADQKDEDH